MTGKPKPERVGGPASGFPARRYSWPPFEPGNSAARTHGAYATLALGGRVDELAATVRELVPGYTPGDEIAVRVLCLALARMERSAEALDDADLGAGEMKRLRDDERGWANTVRRYLNDLGLTPASRAALGLNITMAKGEALRAHLSERYAEGERE